MTAIATPTAEEIVRARAQWDDHVGWLMKTAAEDGPDREHATYCFRLIQKYVELASVQYGETATIVERVSRAYEAFVGPVRGGRRGADHRRGKWVREKLAPVLVQAMFSGERLVEASPE